jgi:hypothetical protein
MYRARMDRRFKLAMARQADIVDNNYRLEVVNG